MNRIILLIILVLILMSWGCQQRPQSPQEQAVAERKQVVEEYIGKYYSHKCVLLEEKLRGRIIKRSLCKDSFQFTEVCYLEFSYARHIEKGGLSTIEVPCSKKDIAKILGD